MSSAASSPIDFFERQWTTYRKVVDHDLMEHRALTAATGEAIDAWLKARPPTGPAPCLVDLGCGDLAQLAPLLRRLPLGSYLGLDRSAPVLPRAAAALGPVPYPAAWRIADLLAWAESPPAALPVQILHSAFAIHHLDDDAKLRFLDRARRHLAPDGVFLWADVFRAPGESRQDYQKRYAGRIDGWNELPEEERAAVIEHITAFDIPADRAAIRAVAEDCGWQWRWLWQGNHQAEALALLTPIA